MVQNVVDCNNSAEMLLGAIALFILLVLALSLATFLICSRQSGEG